jgi:hypothetical protein
VLHGFFHSPGWYVFRNLTAALAVCFWLANVYWVLRDARRRIADPWIVGMAGILALLPLIGPLLWLLVRPLEPLLDTEERQLELRALRQRIRGGQYCPMCGAEADASYRFCPVCASELRPACAGCEAALDPLWIACPYCGTHTNSAQNGHIAGLPSFPELMPRSTRRRASESAAK